MYMQIVNSTARVQDAMAAGEPVSLTQDEYDTIDAHGLLYEEDALDRIEVVVES